MRITEFAKLSDNHKDFVIYVARAYATFKETEIVRRRLLWIAIARKYGVSKDIQRYAGCRFFNVEYTGYCYPQDYFAYRTSLVQSIQNKVIVYKKESYPILNYVVYILFLWGILVLAWRLGVARVSFKHVA